jgi:hypothetical protein
MENIVFKLTNNYGVVITLSLEPEGSIYELQPGQSVDIELTKGENPVIDFQINKDEGGLYLALWPEKGEYKIR